MAKPLVIVESPAKAKTLGRFLGSKYRVEASYGHIRDLPESAALNVARARIEDVIQFFESEIAYFNLRGL